MKAISATQHFTIISLLQEGYSYTQIQTGLGRATISRIKAEVLSDKENNPAGRPSKLTTHHKQSIVCQISSGKLDNAVQATQFINYAIPNPVTSQTVRNVLKKNGFHSATKKTVPMLKKTHCQK
jgi:transposase